MESTSKFRPLLVTLALALASLLLFPLFYVSAQPASVAENPGSPNSDELAYITLSDSDLVVAVNAVDYTVPFTIDVGTAGCDFPWRAALAPGGGQMLVSCAWSDNVILIDTTTNAVTATVESLPDAAGLAYTWDGSHVLVGSRYQSQLAILDRSTMSPVFLGTSAPPRSVATHPFRDLAYAALTNGNVLVVDTANMVTVTTIPFGSDVWDVAVSPDGQWVYASDRRGAGLAVIATASNALHTTVSGIGELNGITLAPDGSAVYASQLWAGIHIVETDTFAETGFVSIPDRPWELAATCDGNRLIVGNTGDEAVIYNLATQSLLSVPLPGWGARGVAACPPPLPGGAQLVPAQKAQQAALGESVTYELSLWHLEPLAHTYTLDVVDSTWPASVSTTTLGPVAYGEAATFTVEITVPADASWYEAIETVISATSTTDGGITDSAGLFTTAYAPPELSVSPESASVSQIAGESASRTITIQNGNGVTTTFEVDAAPISFVPFSRAHASAGGPDAFGYTYRDSEEADGPTYGWEDISGSGTALAISNMDDYYVGPVPIGFPFDFYGTTYDQLYVGSNGYLTFGSGSGIIPYGTIPNTGSPNNVVALFGGDMYLASDSAVYYQTLQNPTRFVLVFEDLYYCCGSNTSHTLEVILYPNGNILSQYQTLNGTTSDFVGIENEDGTAGLSYPGPLSDGLAICYAYPGNPTDCRSGDVPWLTIMPDSGHLAPNDTQPLEFVLNAQATQPGTYTAEVLVASDDPAGPAVVAVTMDVSPAATMGRVSGTVVDAWTAAPLTATVRLADVYTITATPDYNIWADAGSYELEVSAPGYVTETETIVITAGEVTRHNPALEPAQPRLHLPTEQVAVSAVAGATVSYSLPISNTGPLPLEVTVFELTPTLETGPLDATVLENTTVLFDAGHSGPGIYEFDTLIYDLEFAGATVIEHFDAVDEDALEGVDILWVNCCGSAWSAAELATVAAWVEQGGAIFIHGPASTSTEAVADLFAVGYQNASCTEGTTDRFGDHPILEGIDALYLGWTCDALEAPAGATVVVYDEGTEEARLVAGTNGVGRLVVSASSLFNNWAINNEDNRSFAAHLFEWLATPVHTDFDWLATIPDSLRISGHGSDELVLHFDTIGLAPGSYQAMLGLVHNDPDAAMARVPVELTVGYAGFRVLPSELEIAMPAGQQQELTLMIEHTGTVPANWSLDVVDDPAWLSLSPTGGTLSPSAEVTVTILVDASDLRPDLYEAEMRLVLEDTNEVALTIPLTLTVENNKLFLPMLLQMGGG